MQKSSFAKRALKTHFEVVQEFLESMAQIFTDDEELKDGILFNRNVVMGDDAKMTEGVEAWCENMHEPLKKGAAKYMRAVESITGSPACVYHAFHYRDTGAMMASSSSPNLKRLDLHTKMLMSDVWDVKSKAICWEYLDELNRTAFEAVAPTSKWAHRPVVPTRNEIQSDIARRKGTSSTSSGKSTQSVQEGIRETFQKICALRGVACTETTCRDISKTLSFAAAKTVGDTTLGDMCRAHDPNGFFGVMKICVGKDVDLGEGAIEEETWDLMNKCIGLATMKSAIPAPMMSGIENMANKLVNDIASGKTDLSSLNVESIGQQVLSQVSPDEMNEFASNIDKILPALGNLKPF